nr:type II secretion system major pseudopilin GspG [Maricaulis sp.]
MADQNTRREAGYTLSELLIVLAVLAMVAAAVTPALLSRFNNGQTRSAQLQATTLAMAMDDFLIDVGRYPTPQEGVSALWQAPDAVTGWSGPYVRSPRTLEDPWGNHFVIELSSDPNIPPFVVSLGADGAPGGDGQAADIRFPE